MTLVTQREHLQPFQYLGEVTALAGCTVSGPVFVLTGTIQIGNMGVRKGIGEHGHFLTRRHSPLSNGVLRKSNFGALLLLLLIQDWIGKPLFRASLLSILLSLNKLYQKLNIVILFFSLS